MFILCIQMRQAYAQPLVLVLLALSIVEGVWSQGPFITNSQPKAISYKASDVSRASTSALGAALCLLSRPKSVSARPLNNINLPLQGSPGLPTTLAANSALKTANAKGSKDAETFIDGLVSGAATRISKEILLHPFDTGSYSHIQLEYFTRN